MDPNSSTAPQNQETPPQEENLLDDVYDNSMEGYDKPVKRVRILLFIIAGLQTIGLFTAIDLPEPENWFTIGYYLFVGVVFLALGFWTKWKPYWAIITAMVFYSSLLLLNAWLEPASILQGIVLKVVIFSLLIAGLKNSKDVQQWLDDKRIRERS